MRAVFWLHLPTVSRVSLLKTELARPPNWLAPGNELELGGFPVTLGWGRGGGTKVYWFGVAEGIDGVEGMADGGPEG